MAAYDDYKDDWKHDDEVETVLVAKPGDPRFQQPIEGVKARRGEVSLFESDGIISVLPGEAPWVVFIDTLEGAVIGPGCLLRTEAGECWEIRRGQVIAAGTRYFCAALLKPHIQ